MIAHDALAPLRPRPSGPPLRGRAERSERIMKGRLVGRQNTKQRIAGSTLNSTIRGLRLGVSGDTCLATGKTRGMQNEK